MADIDINDPSFTEVLPANLLAAHRMLVDGTGANQFIDPDKLIDRSNHTGTQTRTTISDFEAGVSANATVTNNTSLANTAQSTADTANTNAGTALIAANSAQSDVDAVEVKTDQITITAATNLDAIRVKLDSITSIGSGDIITTGERNKLTGLSVTDNQNIITSAQIALLNKFNLEHTKQAISGTGIQTFDLNNGTNADSTISGNQTLDFVNTYALANGVVKFINTDGNTLTLSGSGITFKKSVEGVLEANAPTTLEAGATTEQLLVFSFQSAKECIYQIK